MRRGWLLLALFCSLILSGCGGVTGGLVTNPLACRPKRARLDAALPSYLLRLGRPQVEKQKCGVSITLSSDCVFQPGVCNIELSNKTDIDVLVTAGKKYPQTTIAVDVYTDCIHTEEQNLALSQLEAWMIKQALVDSGIPSKRITAQGWGESRPVATNATEDGRKANRRIRITFEQTNS